MAKKKINYKTLKVDENDLAVTKIGMLSSQEKSPIFLLLIFGLLFAVVFFMPNITKYIEERKNPVIIENDGQNDPTTKEPVTPSEIVYYDLTTSTIISLEENIKISDILLEEKGISFNITNNGENKFYLNKYNYFLEIYSENNTFLERVMLNKDSLNSGEVLKQSYSIAESTVKSAKKVAFVKKDISDYPSVNLVEDENKEATLICSKNDESITYRFNLGKLKKINHIVNYVNGGDINSYQENMNYWKLQVKNYSKITGVSATFMEAANSFLVSISIDLEIAKDLNNDIYYALDTIPKVVSFEMNARGYSCK